MIFRASTFAMGTRFEAVLAGADAAELRAAAEEALAEIEEWDQRLSVFRRDSMVSLINRDAADRPVRVDWETYDLLRTCVEVCEQSGGAFDITIGPLMRLHGFRDGSGSGGASEEIHHAVIGSSEIEFDERECAVRFRRDGMAIDLGAIGKGHALDCAAERLRDAGVTRAFMHGGTSTAIAIGAPPDADGWRVAIRDPGMNDASKWPVATLCDAALSVSAPHGREVESEGRTHGHVLDPRTGESVDAARFAAVVSESARLADAWSTALLVLNERPARLNGGMTTILPGGDTTDRYRVEGGDISRVSIGGAASAELMINTQEES